MRIVVVGVHHASAALPIRERLAVPPGELEAALRQLTSVVREGFIVSTCSRTEVYGIVGHDSTGAERLLRFFADRSGLEIGMVRDACYVHTHEAAIRHALRVTSGLDSAVLGEDQVQCQMKRAIAVARATGALGATLERLGSSALACGKRVRTFTGIGRHAVSLESLAVRAATERLHGIAEPRVVVVGAGESAGLLIRHLAAAGAGRMTIVSRSLRRASTIARRVNAGVRPWTELPEAIADADALFACTAAAHAVVTRSVLTGRLARRGSDPLLCVDLGMPRCVDAAVASLAGVTVVALDELALLAEAHRAARRQHIPAAEAIVNAEADRFVAWLSARGVAQTIASLNAHANAVTQQELERVMPRLQSLSLEQRDIVAQMARRLQRKLMHRPIAALKSRAETDPMVLMAEESVS